MLAQLLVEGVQERVGTGVEDVHLVALLVCGTRGGGTVSSGPVSVGVVGPAPSQRWRRARVALTARLVDVGEQLFEHLHLLVELLQARPDFLLKEVVGCASG